MNQVILVGIVDKCPEIVFGPGNNRNNKLIKFRLKTEKQYKGKNGEILEDYINIKVWDNNIDNIDDLLEVDNVIGIKGRISSFVSANNPDNIYNEVIADKLYFIS